MPAIDKWPEIIQWVTGIGVLIGGAVAGFFGTKIAGRRPPDDDSRESREDERQRVEQARIDERRRVELESQVAEGRMRSEFDKKLEETRSSFYKTFEKYHNEREGEFSRLNDKIDQNSERVHELKSTVTGLQEAVESLKTRRPRQ